jgi:hypothetical protein
VPAPEGGVMSVSPLVLPSPGLVLGDSLRDSLGLAAPLRVTAYDIDGNPVPGAEVTFVVLDTGAHIEDGYLIGDDTIATRVAGAVAGLQTAVQTVKVTLAPQFLEARDSVRHVLSVGVAEQERIAALNAHVLNRQGQEKGIEAVIVRYEIVQAPPPSSPTAGPTAELLPNTGSTSASRDTSDASGIVSRQLRLRLVAISAPMDSAIINATASHRGQSLGTVQYTVVFVKQ